jgi:prevent-host-death family protein
MPTVNLRQARKHLHQWVTAAERGATVIITHHGRPVARLVPIEADTWSPALLQYLDGEPPPGEDLVIDRSDLLAMPEEGLFG